MGCLAAQGFPESVIEPMRGIPTLPTHDVGEVSVFGEVLAHHFVGVLTTTSLARTSGVSEIKLGVEGLGNRVVNGELGAVVAGEGKDLRGVLSSLTAGIIFRPASKLI